MNSAHTDYFAPFNNTSFLLNHHVQVWTVPYAVTIRSTVMKVGLAIPDQV